MALLNVLTFVDESIFRSLDGRIVDRKGDFLRGKSLF